MSERKPSGATKLAPHVPTENGLRRIPWLCCRRCGLVYLRNKATNAAIKRGCWLYEDASK